MENAQYVAAVDLGTTKVVIAVGRRAEKGKVEIVALKEAPSLGIIKGDLKNIEQASHALKEVKQKIEEQLGITISEAYVGISGQHIRCNNTSGYVFVQTSDREVSEVSAADVKRLKDEQRNSSTQLGQTIIEVIPQSYKLDEDSEITEPVGMEGKRLEAKFNIIVGEEAAIERIGRCFNRVGLTLAGIKLQPLASAKAVLSDDEKELGVVVVDIGGGTTDVCIYHDKTIRHLAVIPFGGNVINRDIKADGILERHVEKLKTTFGEAISAQAAAEKFINIPSVSGQAAKEVGVKRLAGIIEARMSEIIDFVMFEIERSGYKGKLGAGLVLTGGGALLKNLDMLFKTQMGIDVRMAVPTVALTPESAEMVANPKYSTIVGMIVEALREGLYTHTEVRAMEPVEVPVESVAAEPHAAAWPRESYTPRATTSAASMAPAQQQDVPLSQQDSYDENSQQEYYSQEDEYQEEPEPYTVDKTQKKGIKLRFKELISKMFEPEEVEDDDNY